MAPACKISLWSDLGIFDSVVDFDSLVCVQKNKMTNGQTVLVSSIFSMLYWIAQGSAALYPNTAFVDPQFAQRSGSSVNGIPIQLVGEFVCIALTAFSGWLALRPGQNWQATKPGGGILVVKRNVVADHVVHFYRKTRRFTEL